MCLSSAAPWFLPLFSCYGPTWRTAAVSWQPGCLPFVALLVDFCATPYTNTHHAFVRHCLGFFFLFFGEGGRGGAAAAELWHEFERSDMCLCSLLFLFVFRRVVPLKNTSKRSPEEWQLIWSFVTHYRASQIQAMLGKKTKKNLYGRHLYSYKKNKNTRWHLRYTDVDKSSTEAAVRESGIDPQTRAHNEMSDCHSGGWKVS